MTRIKFVRRLNHYGAYAMYANVFLVSPFVAADLALNTTGMAPLALVGGALMIWMAEHFKKTAKDMARYEEAGRAALQANPAITDEELALEIIAKTSDPNGGKIG